MSRPTCWECGKQLMYVKGKPVWAIFVQDGVEHRVHKQCKEWLTGEFGHKEDNDAYNARHDVRKAFCTTGCKP